MSMSKKHYKELARILGDVQHTLDPRGFAYLCEEIAAMGRRDNPKFDYNRFFSAIAERAKEIQCNQQ